ncbi:hypothetical protein [Streptomyces griseosporeus]|uniref:hypothetical protein n=1 Tax=Streptomyces griseosporeus TaxID=1910 RepID=UPI0036F822D5
MNWIFLGVSVLALATVIWNTRQANKYWARTRAVQRRTWGAIAHMQLVALKTERLAEQLRHQNGRRR